HVATLSRPGLSAISKPVRTPMQQRVPQARRALASRGMSEAVTWSFMAHAKAERFGAAQRADLRLLNSIDATLDTMRPAILPNLIDAAGRNEARRLADPALFEVGPIYLDATPPRQRMVAAGVRPHAGVPRNWQGPSRTVDAFDAKADALAVLAAIAAPDNLSTWPGAPDWYHPGRSGVLKLGDRVMAWFGELHPELIAAADLKGPAVAFEVFLDAPPLPKARPTKARPKLALSAFQPVERDFAFVVDAAIEAEKLVRAARNADKALITEARVFDVYAGKGVPDGKKSLAITVTLQPVERTLTDAEIEAVSTKIVGAVAKATGAVLRG